MSLISTNRGRVTSAAIRRCSARWPAILIVGILLQLGATNAEAALLNLEPQPPDITGSTLKIKYTASSDTFHVWGPATHFELSQNGAPPDFTIDGGWLDITMSVNSSGVLQPGGTLTVTGTISSGSLNATSPLLTAKITKFGYQSQSDLLAAYGTTNSGPRIFEMEFETTGGSLAKYFQGVGGVVLTPTTIAFNGSFNETSFQNYSALSGGNASADIYAEVPEPASLLLWSAISIGLVSLHSRSRRQRCNRTDGKPS